MKELCPEVSQRTRRLLLVAVLGIAVVIGWHSLATSSTPARNKPWVSFTCCRSADVDRVYHPGDTVRIHWIADFQPSGSTGATAPITLTARIVGSFRSVQHMKRQFRMSARGIESEPIHVTEQSLGRHPISEIQLPADTHPGVYSLVTTINDGGVESGASSITVADR